LDKDCRRAGEDEPPGVYSGMSEYPFAFVVGAVGSEEVSGVLSYSQTGDDRIVERGGYEELVAFGDRYRTLYELRCPPQGNERHELLGIQP
jgi:hypothetical protein